jgi:hypothetical protein
VLAGLSGTGLFAALTMPRVAIARAEGGLVTNIRIAGEAIRADRILRMAIVGWRPVGPVMVGAGGSGRARGRGGRTGRGNIGGSRRRTHCRRGSSWIPVAEDQVHGHTAAR